MIISEQFTEPHPTAHPFGPLPSIFRVVLYAPSGPSARLSSIHPSIICAWIQSLDSYLILRGNPTCTVASNISLISLFVRDSQSIGLACCIVSYGYVCNFRILLLIADLNCYCCSCLSVVDKGRYGGQHVACIYFFLLCQSGD